MRCTAGSLTALVFLCATGRLQADPQKEVRVSVVAILASETNTQIDPRLKNVAAEVRKKYPQLKGFRLGQMTCKEVAVNAADSFALVADQQATVTLLKPADKDNKVQLKVSPPTLGDITLTMDCGKFFPIMTQYQTANKESLIIAVRVQPCNKK
jgi:hypothetical protein